MVPVHLYSHLTLKIWFYTMPLVHIIMSRKRHPYFINILSKWDTKISREIERQNKSSFTKTDLVDVLRFSWINNRYTISEGPQLNSESKFQVKYYNYISDMTHKLNSRPTFDAKDTGVAPSTSSFIQKGLKFCNSNPNTYDSATVALFIANVNKAK